MRWFYNISIKKKFHFVFISIIAALFMGLVIGQIAFRRVQVGGRFYNGIALKRETVDNIARIRMNLNFINGLLFYQEFLDRDVIDGIKDSVARTDHLFQELLSKESGSEEKGTIYCSSCHPGDFTSAIFNNLRSGKEYWDKYRARLTGDVIPVIMSEGVVDSKTKAGLFDLYQNIMSDTGSDLETLRGALPLQAEILKKEVNLIRVGYIVAGIFAGAVLLVIMFVLIAIIIRPVQSISIAFKALSEGDFREADISVKGDDEIGRMVNAFRLMTTKVSGFVRNIRNRVLGLSSTSEELSATSEELSSNAGEQFSQVEHVVAATTEMAQTVMDIAQNASRAADATRESSELASGGRDLAANAMSEIERIAVAVKKAAEMIESLGNSSK